MSTVGSRIRHLREQDGQTLMAFAERLGLSKGHLSKIETDQQMPRLGMLVLIAAELDVPIAALINEE